MTSPLSPLDALALVHLRALLENARLTARSTAPVSRLTALVLLDAVVERVTHMAAVSLPGVHVKAREEFESLVGKVKEELGTTWISDSWSDIRKLHRARNLAQHEGVSADPTLLPGWTTATERYARSLVNAVYHVNLDHILLADVVKHPRVNPLISEAENFLRHGDAAKSIERSSKAFSVALSLWRRNHESMHDSSSARPLGFKDFHDLHKLIDDTRTVSAAQSFATDPGEYMWFRRVTSGHVESLTTQDAQRALAFTFWWVVRWEAIQADLSFDRQGEWAKQQRKVRAPGVSEARILDAEVDASGLERGDYVVVIKLADVPDEDRYDLWRSKLTTKLRSAEQGEVRARCFVTNAGTIRLHASASSKIDAVVQVIQDFLVAVEQEIDTELIEANRAGAELQNRVDQFSSDIEAIREKLPFWIAEIYLKAEPNHKTGLRVKFAPEVGPVIGVQEIIRSSSGIENCYPSSNGSYVLSPQLDVPSLISALHEVDPAMRQAIEASKQRANEKNAEHEALKRNLELAMAKIRMVSKRKWRP